MEDMDLHFTKADTYENQPKARKPFPVDFSFNRDGELTDSAIEEVKYEIPQETAEEFEEIFEAFHENFQEDDADAEESSFKGDEAEDQTEFSDEFLENTDDFHSESTQCDSGLQQIEEGCADTYGNRLLQDNRDAGDGGDEEAFGDEVSFFEDEDDSALWDEFKDIFETQEADAEDVSAFEETEREESKDELLTLEAECQVLPILEDTAIEEAVEPAESEEDYSELEDEEEDLAQYADFDDGETEFQGLPIPEDTAIEEAVEPAESEEDYSELEDEEEEEDLAQYADFDDEEAEFQVLPLLNQEEDAEVATEDEATESVIQPMFIDLSESEAQSEETDVTMSVYAESDTDCESVVIPKTPVSVTTWERARQRASANVQKDTIETEHFFAVSEHYINEGRNIERQPAGNNRPTVSPIHEDVHDIKPIWQIDEPGTTDWDTEPEIRDEDLDYDDIFNDDHDSYRKKKRVKNIFKKIFKEFMIFLLIVVSAVFLVANFTVFISRQNTVYGSSMEPTLYAGDHVYTTLLPYIFGEPEIGDIIVLNYSEHEHDRGYFHMLGEVLRNNRLSQWILGKDKIVSDTYWIKRVVAVAGDVVSFKNNQFYRNGEVVTEDYLLDQNVTKYNNGEEILVPDGCVFVMGDNRNISHDSRVIGCISTEIIIGKMWKKG